MCDGVLILDDTRVMEWHVAARLKLGEDTNMWSFTAAEYLKVWRACTAALNIQDLAISHYENRHGGASRDHLIKLRSVAAIHASAGIYDKPDRL